MKFHKYLICIALCMGISSNLFAYTHTIKPDQARILSVQNGQSYAEFNSAELSKEPGEPELPCFTYKLLVEPDADLNNLSVTVEGLAEERIPGTYLVRPVPLMRTQDDDAVIIPEGKNIVDGKDIAIYASDSFFPKTYAAVYNAGQLNYYKVVTVEFRPYRYNPVTGELIKYTSGNIVLDVPKIQDYPTIRGIVYAMDIATVKEIQYIADNYKEMAHLYAEYETRRHRAVGLAIITTSAIKSGSKNLTAFVDSKKSKGYDVVVVTEEEWGTGTGTVCDKLRAWIKSNYQAKNIKHVLLIGNPNPTNGDLAMYKAGTTPTDWYYGELSSTTISNKDCMAEVHVGRIPVYSSGDITKLDKVFNKIIKYETAPKNSIAWRFNAELAYKPCDANTQCYELGEQIRCSTLVALKDWKWVRVYDKTYNLNPPPEFVPCSEANTQKAWKEQKPGCVFWDTHGSATSSVGMINTTAAASLDDNYPVYTFQGACLNAKPDVNNNLCYTLCVNGAIAANAATISVSYTPGEKDYTKSASIGGQEYWYAKFLIKDSLPTAEASDMARAKINGKSWANHCALVLYGDPTMSPYLCSEPTPIATPLSSTVTTPNILTTNRGVTFALSRAHSGTAVLNIYTVRGQLVYSIDKKLSLLDKSLGWNYHTVIGDKVGSGIYLAALTYTNSSGAQETYKTAIALQK